MRTSIRRAVRAVARLALVLLVVTGGLAFAVWFNFHRPAPRAAYSAPASPVEAQRQDLDYFAKVIVRDRAFSPSARQAAQARLATLRALPEALPPQQLQVALMQVMALADNGHSRVAAMVDGGTLILPVRVTRFAEGLYVTRAAPAYRDLLGGRLQSIDGQPIDRIVAQLKTLRGGVEGFRQENAAIQILVQNLLYGLGIAADPKASTWTVVLPDGQTVTRQLDAYPMQQGGRLPAGRRWLSPEPTSGIEQGWEAYRPQSAALPATWRDLDTRFSVSPAQGSCAQVVRVQSIGDEGEQKLAPFFAATEAAFRANPPCAVILDLRGNGGGDYTQAWHFAHALPGLLAPGGRIVVLTDPATFSAAITTVAFVKDAGGDRVRIVGEPVGDRLSFYAEGGKACLPNLKACVHYQTAKHDYGRSCDDWRECFWLNRFFPVRVGTLQPDAIVPLTFEDWSAGRDAAYETANRLVAEAGK